MPETQEETFRRYEDATRWVAAWNWVQGCPGLEVYIAQNGIELRKNGIRLWAPNIVVAVHLALLEGWGYEQRTPSVSE